MKNLLLLRLWNYLRGYVIIVVNGYFVEKFMNVCTHRQIFLWDIRRRSVDTLTMKISIAGFRLLRPVAKKTGCRVRVVKKRGLPFILNRYRKRKTFLVGAFLFILLIYAMTSFVWSVDISGNKKLETVFITELLDSCDIKPGVLKYTVDTEKAISYMMLNVKELSWVSINVHGTRVKVQVREGIVPPSLVPKDEPCNVIASKDGIISYIVAEEGYEAVQVGDTVQKGQVLISGKIPVKNEKDKYRITHAMGTVKARTWYEAVQPVVTENIEKVRTNRVLNNYTLVFFSKKIGLFHRKADFESSEMEEIINKVEIGDLVFPFEIITERFYENKTVTVELSAEEAKDKAASDAYKEIEEELPQNVEIVKKDIKFISDDDEGYIVRITVECNEEIGMTEEIGGY